MKILLLLFAFASLVISCSDDHDDHEGHDHFIIEDSSANIA